MPTTAELTHLSLRRDRVMIPTLHGLIAPEQSTVIIATEDLAEHTPNEAEKEGARDRRRKPA